MEENILSEGAFLFFCSEKPAVKKGTFLALILYSHTLSFIPDYGDCGQRSRHINDAF